MDDIRHETPVASQGQERGYSKVANRLVALAQLDSDAVQAYTMAIAATAERAIQLRLEGFRADHEQHLRDLAEPIRRLGGTVPEAGVKPGFFIEGMTDVNSSLGTKGALLAMLGNEMLTNARYRSALSEDLPADIGALLERNYADEQRHLVFIRETLQQKFGYVDQTRRQLRHDYTHRPGASAGGSGFHL